MCKTARIWSWNIVPDWTREHLTSYGSMHKFLCTTCVVNKWRNCSHVFDSFTLCATHISFSSILLMKLFHVFYCLTKNDRLLQSRHADVAYMRSGGNPPHQEYRIHKCGSMFGINTIFLLGWNFFLCGRDQTRIFRLIWCVSMSNFIILTICVNINIATSRLV